VIDRDIHWRAIANLVIWADNRKAAMCQLYVMKSPAEESERLAAVGRAGCEGGFLSLTADLCCVVR
jgi:hypothetical protein